MVEHMVLFKLHEGVSEADKQAMLEGLRALPGQIVGIEHLACGEDFSGRSQGYHIGLIVRFASRDFLEQYGPHPAHQEFVTRFKSLWADVLALDFESPKS